MPRGYNKRRYGFIHYRGTLVAALIGTVIGAVAGGLAAAVLFAIPREAPAHAYNLWNPISIAVFFLTSGLTGFACSRNWASPRENLGGALTAGCAGVLCGLLFAFAAYEPGAPSAVLPDRENFHIFAAGFAPRRGGGKDSLPASLIRIRNRQRLTAVSAGLFLPLNSARRDFAQRRPRTRTLMKRESQRVPVSVPLSPSVARARGRPGLYSYKAPSPPLGVAR